MRVDIRKGCLVFILAGEFEGHVLGPLIMARATRLHPVTVLLALVLGTEFGGIGGAVVAIPTAAFLKLVVERVLQLS